MRRYAYIFALAAIALGGQGVLPPALAAGGDTRATSTFHFNSILPRKVEYDDEGGDINFVNIDDRALQEKLEPLGESYGYNYFESLKSGSMNGAQDETTEYRIDDSTNFYCKVTLRKTQKWIDDEEKGHTYITFIAKVVEKVKDNEGNIAEKKVIEIERTKESGKYLLLVFREFYPETEEERARDLVLAIKATG